MLRLMKNQNASDVVVMRVRHDTDTITIDPDVFELGSESFELKKRFTYRVKAAQGRRTISGYVCTDREGIVYMHVDEAHPPPMPPKEKPLTEKEKKTGSRTLKYPDGGLPNRMLSIPEWYAEARPDAQPPGNGQVNKAISLFTSEVHKQLTPRYCLFRVHVPEGPVDLAQLTIEVWSGAKRTPQMKARGAKLRASTFAVDLLKKAEARTAEQVKLQKARDAKAREIKNERTEAQLKTEQERRTARRNRTK